MWVYKTKQNANIKRITKWRSQENKIMWLFYNILCGRWVIIFFLAILKQFSEAFFKSLLLHNAWEISPFFSQNSNSLVWIMNYKKSLPTITIPFFSNSKPQLVEIFSDGEFSFLCIRGHWNITWVVVQKMAIFPYVM